MNMTIAFIGGGTLGHIYPAIPVIKYLKEHYTYKIIFIATKKDEKYDVLKNSSLFDKVYYLDVLGLNKKYIIKTLIKIKKVEPIIKEIIIKDKINLMIGMGGYISGISLMVGIKNKIPTIIHEQNSVMGLANKLLLNKVNKVLLAIPINIRKKYKDKTFVIGNPRMDEASNYQKGLIKPDKQLLITSGTLGSKVINDMAITLMNSDYLNDYQITLITGEKYYKEVISKINKKLNHLIIPFSKDMFKHYIKASIVIARSGATTIFELLGFKKSTILIPSPNVTNHHQEKNAQYFTSLGLTTTILEKDLELSKIVEIIKFLETSDFTNKIINWQKTSPTSEFIKQIKISLEEYYGEFY